MCPASWRSLCANSYHTVGAPISRTSRPPIKDLHGEPDFRDLLAFDSVALPDLLERAYQGNSTATPAAE